MKNLIITFAIIFLMVVNNVNAQNDTTKINCYIGLVGSGFFKKSEVTKWANTRIGVRYKEKIFRRFDYDGRIGFDPGSNDVIFYSALKTEWKNFGISAGYQPTPVSEIRPTPLSVDAQFQFTAEAIPPGGSLGVTLHTKNFKVGMYSRNKKMEYQLTYKYNFLTMGVWTNTVDSIANIIGGITAKVELPYLYAMVSITADNRQALALSICPIKDLGYRAIWDIAFREKQISSNLVGVMKFLKVKQISDARIGMGYDFVNKSIGTFFLIGFNYKK